MKNDMHQVDYANANKEQQDAIAQGKLSKKEEERIRKQLEASLRSRQMDYLGDQLKDYRDSHGCDATGPCRGITLFGARLLADSEKFVQYKLKQFDSPVIGNDFLTNKVVKMPDKTSREQLRDVTIPVEAKRKDIESKMVDSGSGFANRAINYLTLKEFGDDGDYDFKANPDIMGEDAKEHGYQDYVLYNDKIVQQSDLANMLYGHVASTFKLFDLGLPNDAPQHESDPKTTLFSSGHYRQVKSWEEYDRSRDQRAMAQGFRCGMSLVSLCTTDADVGSPRNVPEGRVRQ